MGGSTPTTPENCPKCGAPLPAVRKPTDLQEMLWGGWTCEKCGFKMDKWGRERADNKDKAA